MLFFYSVVKKNVMFKHMEREPRESWTEPWFHLHVMQWSLAMLWPFM